MPKDIEAILEELELVPASFKRILEALVPAWTKRCEELLTKGERDFCFVWDAKSDGPRGSGVFYRRNMVRQRFGNALRSSCVHSNFLGTTQLLPKQLKDIWTETVLIYEMLGQREQDLELIVR